jgi:hypothetical protein
LAEPSHAKVERVVNKEQGENTHDKEKSSVDAQVYRVIRDRHSCVNLIGLLFLLP